MNNTDLKKDETFQKVSYLYGIQLFNKGEYQSAIDQFEQSIGTAQNPEFGARALFWKAESLYRLENFQAALTEFKKFGQLPSTLSIEEQDYYLYHIAYTYFQMGDYNQAGGHFNEFIAFCIIIFKLFYL